MPTPMQDIVQTTLRRFKEAGATTETTIPLMDKGTVIGRLEPIGLADAQRPEATALLAKWREKANPFFPSQFPVTLEGTHRWLVKGLLETRDRILFWVKTADGTPVGHVGLFRFDFDQKSVEVDNIVRGEDGVLPGGIQTAIAAMLDWTFDALAVETALLRVMSDNDRAINLYRRLGFQEIARVPLRREMDGAVVHWVEVDDSTATRFFVTMRLPRAEWRAASRMAA